MASIGGMRPSFSPRLTYLSAHTNARKGPKCRKYRRSRSAPLANYGAGEAKCIASSDSVHEERSKPFMHLSFVKVAVFLTAYLGLGTLCFSLAGDQLKGDKTNAVLDAVYFCVVTMTTLGYGDLVPNSTLAKLLACAYVFAGMALVALILSKAADYLVERQELLLVKSLQKHQKFGEVLKEVKTKSVRYKCVTVFIILLVLMTCGTIFLATVEKLDIVDAFYCVCCSITSLGYGDKSFSTEAGRIFAVFWILSSTTCLAQFFLYIAELNTQHRQKALVAMILTRELSKDDLEAADLDDDGVVGATEFVIYKLKEMGKINQEDVRLVMKEFEALDVDQNGSLTISDVTLAQSSTP
ncbi:two-pore potassium channel 1 [Argentina anserina]|uniref:two-pore potassium channel 1 n=1 Tax=Argentina anserina TaxID=57926 RepID=UPI0021765715|nr:two-pore potassium channel 1 [Potentilla anserina]